MYLCHSEPSDGMLVSAMAPNHVGHSVRALALASSPCRGSDRNGRAPAARSSCPSRWLREPRASELHRQQAALILGIVERNEKPLTADIVERDVDGVVRHLVRHQPFEPLHDVLEHRVFQLLQVWRTTAKRVWRRPSWLGACCAARRNSSKMQLSSCRSRPGRRSAGRTRSTP
jgi:hypothetical protein